MSEAAYASLIRETGSTWSLFQSRRRHTRYWRGWSSDVCSSDLCKAGEQFVLAMEAAVRTVTHVIRVVEFLRLHVLVNDAEAVHEGLGIALVRFGKRGGVGGDSDGVRSQGAMD